MSSNNNNNGELITFHGVYPRREEVETAVRQHVKDNGGNPIWVGMDGMSAAYGYARDHGLITREVYEAARLGYGRSFNYAGC